MQDESKKIGTFSVILMILVAILSINWLATSAAMGPPAVIFWLICGALFYLPLSIIVIEMTNNFSADGGMYLWVRQALGPKSGFFTAWLYWVNNLFYYPSLLVFMVANFFYLFSNKNLEHNNVLMVSIVIALFWLAILINIRGIKFMSRVSGFAGILNISLILFIIVSGATYYWLYHKTSTAFSLASFIPKEASFTKNLSNLSILMFALSGVELIPTLAGSIKNSGRSLPKGILISSIILISAYILGTVGMNVLINPANMNNTTGLMAAIELITTRLHIPRLAILLCLFLLIIEMGGLIVWLIAPTVMFFECVEDNVIPQWLQKSNKHGSPANALIIIGIIVTLILISTTLLPTINSIFTTLVLMSAIVNFIPYLFLIIAYIKLKRRNQLAKSVVSKPLAYTLSLVLFSVVCFGLAVCFIPNEEIKTTSQKIIYELNIVLEPLGFILLGAGIYYLGYLRKKRVKLSN